MFDTVCILNNRVVCVDPNASLVLFEYTRFKADNNSQPFKEFVRYKIPLSNDFKVKHIFLEVVENYSVGLKCLMIVALDTFNEISVFMFCETLKKSVFRLKNLGWPKCSNTKINENLFITHGPTLIFFLEDAIHVYSLSHNTRKYIDLKTIFPVVNNLLEVSTITPFIKQVKVLQLTSVGQLNESELTNVLLLIVSHSTSVNKEIYISCLGINVKQNNQQASHIKLPTSLFFPRCFQIVLRSINVTNIKVRENLISSINEINWKDNFTFLSTQQELMVFNSGVLKNVIQLPSPNALFIKPDFCDFESGNMKLILMSGDKDVHLLATDVTLNSYELQSNKTWTAIESVLFGDILLNASKHLLLLKDTTFNSWQDDCIISDISSSNPVDIVRQTSESDVAMNRAIPGWLAKVQKGKLNIMEAESKISKKLEATLDALFRLKDSNSDDEIMEYYVSSFQESLVDIILHKDENCRTKIDASKSTVNLKVENHWIKCIDNRCVCCWTFSNNESTIFNPTFVISVQNQHIQCTQKLFVHKFDAFSIEDECRRQVNPGERFSVVVSSEIPEFHRKNIEVSAVLSWYIGTSLEFENEIYLPIQEKTLIQQQMNLQTEILSSDIIQTQLQDVSSADCVACMKVIQQRIVLTVFSLHSDVTSFENDLLTSAYGVAHLLLIENLNIKCLVFKRPNLPLYGVHLIFNSLNSKTLEIEAFTKNDMETYLLVQFLYQYFPQDVVILPSGICHAERDQLKQLAVRAMKEEVDLLLSTFTIHNVVEMIIENNSKVLNEAGTIVIPKETFMRIRKTLVKKECATDNIMQSLS